MRKQGNMTSPKVSSTIMDTNDSKVDDIPDKEFKRMIIRMINKTKEDINKCLNEFKQNINKSAE
jgi:hypothetical protein